MAQWKKLLARVVTDPRPVSYTYDELANLLVAHLGFVLAKGTGSHRRFRREIPDPAKPGTTIGVIIGLVDYGRGTLPPEYVKEMVRTLQVNGLITIESL